MLTYLLRFLLVAACAMGISATSELPLSFDNSGKVGKSVYILRVGSYAVSAGEWVGEADDSYCTSSLGIRHSPFAESGAPPLCDDLLLSSYSFAPPSASLPSSTSSSLPSDGR